MNLFSPKEITLIISEVKSGYEKLYRSTDPHSKKVGFYGIGALNRLKAKFLEEAKKKSGQNNPPRFF
tara:strand:+ start:953 stop:1153 length:201 start_codon:yes stop_codon:yes gene_type:complete